MAAWNELLNETKATGSTHDVLRRKYLKKLSQHTKRNVIIYYSGWLQKPDLLSEPAIQLGISDADKNGFMSAIHKMDRTKGLDLILHTPGGDMAATESIVDYLRAMFGKDIRAFIPQLAMSGGTIIALSCKEIIMGKGSSIGPIDPQFGSIAAANLLQEFEVARHEIAANPSAALLWQPILQQVAPGFISHCRNALKWSEEMADRFLRENMFSSDPDADAKISKIIKHLTDSSSTKHHGRHISIAEAEDIFGNKVMALEADQRLQDLVLTVHHCAMITMQSTGCYKIIENDKGKAFMQVVAMQMVGPQRP